MTAYLSKAVYCLYCIWPGACIFVAWFMCRAVEARTYFGALTPGVDPVSPAGQAEFDTRRTKDATKRKIIYWTAGIVAAGFLAAFLWNTFSVSVKAAELQLTPTATLESSPTLPPSTATPTPAPADTLTPPPSSTPQPSVPPTYAPTATNRVIYVAGPEVTVEVTVIVERWQIVTATPEWTPVP
jgi:hypothetical protein